MKRRTFLQQSSLFAGSILIPVGVNGWVSRSLAQTTNSKRLIVIFLRGAADGLNLVIPYRESNYYELRPTIAIAAPGEKNGAIDLDGTFALHPALKAVMPLWEQKSLAFVHASGSHNETRSHFDAQDYMESGTPGVKTTPTGWMNRTLAAMPKTTPTQAVNVGNTTPRILLGKMPVASITPGNKTTGNLQIDRPQIQAAFDRLYSGNDPLSVAYREGEQARAIVLSELKTEMMEASRGAPSPNNLSKETAKLAKLMRGDAKTQLGFLDLGGWDTHVNETNQLNNLLKPLGQGLASLVQELGPLYADTTIIVMSEFGRTVKENGNRGSDHGHGNVMWILGGGIRGGKVYGTWPGLDESQLHEGRDLAITTDFRDVVSSILKQHLQIPTASMSQIFPNYKPQQELKFWA